MKRHFLDSTDRRILRELRMNCRRSARELASELKLSPSSLIERMKRMEEAGIIRGYSADLDFLKIGYEFQALVQISISQGKLLEVQEKVSKLPGVYAVYDVTGSQDSIAFLMCRNRVELSSLIKKILSIAHVEKTNTSIILNVLKDQNEFVDV
ncbi:MAG: Lrp/AsnC family transcriptional regulator [Candidatus ainarchaeum sp.]|nr:Lrp/AsnC family transcriptional regulator [Candidatus ainarchaeum sp.]